jgi:hypothetical protein
MVYDILSESNPMPAYSINKLSVIGGGAVEAVTYEFRVTILVDQISQ